MIVAIFLPGVLFLGEKDDRLYNCLAAQQKFSKG